MRHTQHSLFVNMVAEFCMHCLFTQKQIYVGKICGPLVLMQQLINVRARPLYQLFQPLKSLILKTRSFSSSLAQSESISVAMQTLQLPLLKASSRRLLQTDYAHCFVALFFSPSVCRLSAFYEGGKQFYVRVLITCSFMLYYAHYLKLQHTVLLSCYCKYSPMRA